MEGRGKRYYKSADGTSLAISFANEIKPLAWWFGLADESTDVAVLICHDKAKKEHSIILPVAEIDEEWGQLTRGETGEIKFNVKRMGDKYVLKIPKPHMRDMDVTKYLDNYDPLVK